MVKSQLQWIREALKFLKGLNRMKQNLKKNSSKSSKKFLEVVDIKELPQTPPRLNLFNRDVRYLKIKDVKRAYSKLIQDYCKGVVTNEDAKTIVYIFSGYLQLIRDCEFEERLNQLEERVGE